MKITTNKSFDLNELYSAIKSCYPNSLVHTNTLNEVVVDINDIVKYRFFLLAIV